MDLYITSINWLKEHFAAIMRVILLLAIAFPLLKLLLFTIKKVLCGRFSEQTVMLSCKTIKYTTISIVILMILKECGFQLTAILGAAGIAGVAIGFASQTSLSNLISGLFIIFEKPFEIGDLVEVEDRQGLVYSIDLMSIKVRTFDNRLIRIPNETLLKTTVTNLTHFPIRRLDVNVGVAYKEDIDFVTRVLCEVADANTFCLDEPEPVIVFKGFGDSSLDFMLGVFCYKEDFLSLRNSIFKEIKNRFDLEGIEIPFPHRTIYTGEVTKPFPVEVTNSTL